MSIERICSVLGLPPGHWPPDHYTLLGLTPEAADPARVEERVLERMELLRPYQLAYPEAVTEAMNRLAQALVHLTDPDAQRPSDAAPQLPPAGGTELHTDSSQPPEPEPSAPLRVLPPAKLPLQPRSDARRTLFRGLAAARRLKQAWDAAGAVLARAELRLQQPVEAVELVSALWKIRHLTEAADSLPVAHTGQPGALVGALARQPHILHTFRHLLPDQRAALAADWRRGGEQIDELIRSLQRQVRRPRRRLGRTLRQAGRSLFGYQLDLVLLVLGLAALGLAWYRSRG